MRISSKAFFILFGLAASFGFTGFGGFGVAHADSIPMHLSNDIAGLCYQPSNINQAQSEHCVQGAHSYFRDLKLRLSLCTAHLYAIGDERFYCRNGAAQALHFAVTGLDTPHWIIELTHELIVRTRTAEGRPTLVFAPSVVEYLGYFTVTGYGSSCVLEKAELP